MSQLHGNWNLLFLVKVIPEQLGKQRDNLSIGQKHVERIAKLTLSFEVIVIRFQPGNLNDLRNRDSFGGNVFLGILGSDGPSRSSMNRQSSEEL
ncbi:hypothetical protein Nepgr_019003 [Nepenthes gracilis]|uniref:Uncharacterized protein n=1 Tax=Nepenthes gracilis TaxID=150966 RepID=A0AAD3SV36_NEPGR|nr:hypothetical protein Nepgr_019003 [Nepenthes gracilis]